MQAFLAGCATYPVEMGLLPIFDRSGRTNLGHVLKTTVLLGLERRRREVTDVRTPDGNEVDFLVREPGGGQHLIQVSADSSDPATAKREFRALADAGRRHAPAKRWLLTLTRDSAPTDIPAAVTVCPAYDWMLAGA